ncbi:RNA polymerase sigma factor [Thalassotalea piscium]|uniref:RNA polymerase sigma-70 factor (ECF subfamily) n=1 Tax=Thalassotalea piscium TaxID=1230533 RepID=A0A7X0TVB8_9GAMM|nr:RNA polymerase sigma factor [Thalassotalea piscium]MBB6545009.1 RNA polymerase sigma-70 factor (ECF subfamily) [Thalassotalea piscium]
MEQAKIDLLVIEMQQGSEAAFKEIFDYFQPSLVRFSYKVCCNEQMAKDAVQNSWLKVTKSIGKLKDPRAFKSWLYQMVRWQSIDLVKKAANDPLEFTEQDASSVSQHTGVEEMQSSLLALINLLPEIDRQAIYLFYLEEMKIKEIATILSTPEGTIKSRLNRARNMLKVKIEQLGE